MNKWSGPKEPNCNEMVEYLLKTDGYHGKTKNELLEDAMLKIVASACKISIENVVEIVHKMLENKKSK